ncbi:MAG TPA: FecR domain-containing protein [Puia sp.]|nr:FecR domain-containing protein [Puia sp.]
MPDAALIHELLERYTSGHLTDSDRRELIGMLDDPAYGPLVDEILKESFRSGGFGIVPSEERTAGFLAAVHERIRDAEKTISLRRRSRIIWTITRAAAAAVVLLAVIGTFLYIPRPHPDRSSARSTALTNDIPPGHYGAILTLSNSKQIVLDSAANGSVAGEGAVRVVKKGAELDYEGAGREVLYNTVSTPIGRQWKLTLGDGTRVWLNALSSIRYPVSFTGKERVVEVEGEAYFEVAKNALQPFKVRCAGTEIAVLGTSFNLNAYSDEEAIKTTLVEGSVRVSSAGGSDVLQPGEQEAIGRNGQMQTRRDPDLTATIAWKNDQFYFSDATIEQIMRQLRRWYAIEVNYESKPEQLFIGKISRNEPISKVLNLFELTGQVHFRIEGKTVTVLR